MKIRERVLKATRRDWRIQWFIRWLVVAGTSWKRTIRRLFSTLKGLIFLLIFLVIAFIGYVERKVI